MGVAAPGRRSRKHCRHGAECSDHMSTLNNCGSRWGSGARWPSIGGRSLRPRGLALLLLKSRFDPGGHLSALSKRRSRSSLLHSSTSRNPSSSARLRPLRDLQPALEGCDAHL